MYIYILLAIFIVFLIASYIMFKKDIIQPAVMFCISFVVSIASAVVNIKNWSMELRTNTFLVILLGGIEFLIVSYLIFRYYNKKNEKKETINSKEEFADDKGINIQKWKVILIIIYDIIVVIALILSVLQIASQFGEYNSFSQALTLFRKNTTYSANATLPKMLSLAKKPVFAFAYIMLYFGIYNLIYKKEPKKEKIINTLLYFMPAFFYIINTLIQSRRGAIINIVLAGTIMFLILWYKKNNYKVMLKLKTILIIVVICVIGLMLFYLSAKMIGRKTNFNMIEYITMYCGGSIDGLDLYLNDPKVKEPVFFGEETFQGFIRFLYDYNFIKLKKAPTMSLEWRYANGVMVGNVYTAYRRWIHDFGYVGMFIFQLISAVIYNVAYNKFKYYNKKRNMIFDICLILYAYIMDTLLLISIEGILFINTIKLSFVTQVIVLIVVYYLLVTKFSIKKIDNKPNILINDKPIKEYLKKKSVKG